MELGPILPESSQVIVIICCANRVCLAWVCSIRCIRIVKKAAHPETFIINDPVSKSNSVQGFSRANSISVVNTIVILVWAFEKVDSYGWRIITIPQKTCIISIVIISIVIISQSSIDITSNVIVKGSPSAPSVKNPKYVL